MKWISTNEEYNYEGPFEGAKEDVANQVIQLVKERAEES